MKIIDYRVVDETITGECVDMGRLMRCIGSAGSVEAKKGAALMVEKAVAEIKKYENIDILVMEHEMGLAGEDIVLPLVEKMKIEGALDSSVEIIEGS